MGLAWCRERVEQAHNSKSPVDRILVRCSNLIKPRSTYSRSHGKVVNDFVYKGMRTRNLGSSYSVPVHAVPPNARHHPHEKVYNWKRANFIVGDSVDGDSKPPVPPPRKKRKRKINSAEVLNSELPELCSPGYVIQSENLRRKSFSQEGEERTGENGKETDVPQPPVKSYSKEKRSLGHDRFEKLSRKRMRKTKAEPYPSDETAEKGIKNDGEKRGERKIKHVSTVSLPNYNELIKRNRKVSVDMGGNGDDKNGSQSVGLKLPRRNSSAISLPGEGSNSILGSLSEATIHCLETYMKRCRSFGSLKPQQLFEKLQEFNEIRKSPSESSDSWCGLDEWDLAVIEHCDPVPRPKDKKEKAPVFLIGDRKIAKVPEKKEDRKPEPVPLEWFLNPGRRHPPIADSKPQAQADRAPPLGETEEHSTLLGILTRYKADEREPPETGTRARESPDHSRNESMNFDEVDVEFCSKRNLNPFISMKNRSNSFQEEKFRRMSLTERKPTSRSPSNSLGCSTHLLRQLQNNKEAIEREILQRPNELLERLRRESLFRSVPKDAFEAFKSKKMTSLRDSLNEFLGFKDPATDSPKQNDSESDGEISKPANSAPGTATGETDHVEDTESPVSRETPPMGTPIEITINSLQKNDKSTLFPNALVTFKENV